MQAAIFDMDGLLIDSEPFWKQAEYEVFSSLGVHISKKDAALTATMTTQEVTKFWYQKSPWQGTSLKSVEQKVIEKVSQLIQERGQALPGVHHTLKLLKANDIKTALATNSPISIIPHVLERLNIADDIDIYTSADEVNAGKPEPDVYLLTVAKLSVDPRQCLSFEDSASGVKASLQAGIKSIAVPHPEEYQHKKFTIASKKLRSLMDFDLDMAQQLLSLS